MLEQLLSLLSVMALGLAAYGVGRPILRGLQVGEEDRLSVAVWSLAIGLVTVGGLLACLGFLGALYVPLIGVLTAGACFWGLGEILTGYLQRYEQRTVPTIQKPAWSEPQEPVACAPPPRWLSRTLLLLAAMACLGSLVGALAPPTDGDALCYHLELPKAFLAAHSLPYLPDSDNSTFPLLVEMWYLWALVLDGGVAAQLVHWSMGILLALAAVVLATPLLSRPWAWLVGAVTALVPSVTSQMTAPLNDAALALFCTLTLAAWWRAVIDGESRRWFVLAGLAAGGALGAKYLALLFGAALVLTALGIAWRHPERRRLVLEGTAVIAVVALSLGGFWYVRAAWYRGNPVYPFLEEVFHGKTVAEGGLPTLRECKLPLGRNPLTLVTGAWKITIHPERYGGRGHQLGALFLATLPGLLWARRLRGLGLLMAMAGIYWFLWFLLRQNVRFLLPMAPILSTISLWVLVEMQRLPRGPRWITGAALGLALLTCSAAAAVRCHDRLAVACGWQSRDEFLMQREPTWPAARVLNELVHPDDHILSQDFRAFYFNCRLTREDLYRRRTGYDLQVTDPQAFSKQMREAGFTYLLLAENQACDGYQFDPTLSELAEGQWASGNSTGMTVLTEYDFEDVDGGLRHYRLVMLK